MTKTGRQETIGELETRIREAAATCRSSALRCPRSAGGFATSILGNALTTAHEEAKLRTIVATAERGWQ